MDSLLISTRLERRNNINDPQTIPQIQRPPTLPNTFYVASITLIANPHKDTTKKGKTVVQFP
jgi:hypothetical protein